MLRHDIVGVQTAKVLKTTAMCENNTPPPPTPAAFLFFCSAAHFSPGYGENPGGGGSLQHLKKDVSHLSRVHFQDAVVPLFLLFR